MLEEAGRAQQQLVRDFERQSEQARQHLVEEAEAKARVELGETEQRLRTELEEAHLAFTQERGEMQQRLQGVEQQLSERQGECTAAQGRAKELEEQLSVSLHAPESQEERVRALEMELNLLRSRLAREVASRQMAESATIASREKQEQVHTSLQKGDGEQRRLQRSLAEQQELVAFKQEVIDDLKTRLREHQSLAEQQLQELKSQADKRVLLERSKREAMTRLEGILPKHFISQALT